MKFANVYLVTRRYGGPEEGGWWYDDYNCIEVFPVRGEEQGKQIAEWLEKEHGPKAWGNKNSVLGGAEVHVLVEDQPKASETTERPLYE